MRTQPVDARSADVLALVESLTAELAEAGYGEDETFGYSADQLVSSGVHLLGAFDGERLVGIGGVELQDGGFAELKRMYVEPQARGSGAADALMAALLDHARAAATTTVRLETGDKQLAAIRFYARNGFVEVPRFPPYTESATSVCMQRTL
jgi:putative acetyltransferase